MRWNLLPLTVPLIASPILFACNDAVTEDESIAQVGQAVSVCNETVPPERVVDGIPAYAQCASSRSSPIYSNNGVDTATSALSSEWKRTQFAGGYQCTELLNRYWLFRWNIKWTPNGDAWSWCNSDPPSSSGIVKTTTPAHGDAVVFGKGVCGSDSTYGHVALVDTVDEARSRVTFVEQNQAGRRTVAWSCATCFLHVVASVGSSGASSGGAASTATAQGGSGTATSVANGGRTSSEQNTSVGNGGRSESVGGASSQTGGRARGEDSNHVGGNATTNATSSSGRARGGASNASGTSTNSASSNGGGGARVSASSTDSQQSIGGASSRGGALASGASESTTTAASKPASTSKSTNASSIEGQGGRPDAGDGGTDASALGGSAVDTQSAAADPDAGCSCSAAGTPPPQLPWLGALVLALSLRTRRARRQRC